MAVNGTAISESTPLLSPPSKPRKWSKSVLYRALLCGFMVASSFGVTQVPLLYVFRLMTCEAFYSTHPPPSPSLPDRCSVHEIESSTATAVAILSASTTFFGVFNLFVTSWSIRRFGLKTALISQIFWPAIRLAVQNVGVMTGGARGILIIQCSQIITIIGGPAGYLLALNNFVAEVIEPVERTGALGQLQGCVMFGTSVGFLAGGLISDIFTIETPFRVSWILFLGTCVYCLLCLPQIPKPVVVVNSKTNAAPAAGVFRFFGPLKTFAPQRWVLKDGRVRNQYGAMLLGIGVFLGILATGFIPVLLQLYSTDVLGFGTSENGLLISMNSMFRGIFLTLMFPRIIKSGRKWMNERNMAPSEQSLLFKAPNSDENRDAAIPTLPTNANDFIGSVEARESDEPIEPPPQSAQSPDDIQEIFDLQFTKYSLIADGIITGLATFVRSGWQMYVVAILLPFASGTGSSAKGTILQMRPASERADALSAITLIEMIARLSTTSLFGFIFAAFADIGQPHLVFTCNAVVAVLGFAVLLFCHFPPEGSKRYVTEEDEGHEAVLQQ